MRQLFAVGIILISTLPRAEGDEKHSEFIYLGHAGDTELPVKVTLHNDRNEDIKLKSPVQYKLPQSVRLRTAPNAEAALAGRLPKGTKVPLISLHNNFGYVWAEVDTKSLTVLP